jgi:hypothetical protein
VVAIFSKTRINKKKFNSSQPQKELGKNPAFESYKSPNLVYRG